MQVSTALAEGIKPNKSGKSIKRFIIFRKTNSLLILFQEILLAVEHSQVRDHKIIIETAEKHGIKNPEMYIPFEVEGDFL